MKTTGTKETEQNVSFTPIQLTREGDMLCEYMRSALTSGRIPHTTDDHNLSYSYVGIHKYCGGWIDRRNTTNTYDALVCRLCYLRVIFPKKVTTYGELRQALLLQLVPK